MLNVRLVSNRLLSQRLALVMALGILACDVYGPDLLTPVTTDDEPGPSASGDPTTSSPGSSSPSDPKGVGPTASDPSSEPEVPIAPDVTGVAPAPPQPPTAGPGPSDVPGPDTTAPMGTDPASTSGPTGTVPGPDATGPVGPDPAPTTPSEPEPETPSDDPLIADFEGNSGQLSGGHREGYWFTDGSSEGTITPLDDVFVDASTGNGAAHVLAYDYIATGWAAFGADFNDGKIPPAYVQAVQYDGIRFWACTGDASGMSELFFEVVTLDTSKAHDDTNENNHYRTSIDLDGTWQQYTFLWGDLEQTWGDKRTEFDVNGVIGLRFSLETEGFDLWLDGVEFIEPDDAPSTLANPPTGSCPVTPPRPAADAGAP